MWTRLNTLRGRTILALDGELGSIRDFHFDDETWTIRHMVVDTGHWLSGRRVLIPLWAMRPLDLDVGHVAVTLTREQIRNSPDQNTEQPVSRIAEARALDYYGYPYYWGGPALWGALPAPTHVPTSAHATSTAHVRDIDLEGNHLRSCEAVTGYHLQAVDGSIGHIDDFLVDKRTWRIEHLLIDTSNWIGGRHLRIPTAAVSKVSWADRLVHLTLSRAQVATAPEGSSDSPAA